MSNKGTKRKILTASIGIAAYTALEGLACGNPVAPRCPDYKAGCGPAPEPEYTQAYDAGPATDAGVETVPDAAVEPTP